MNRKHLRTNAVLAIAACTLLAACGGSTTATTSAPTTVAATTATTTTAAPPVSTTAAVGATVAVSNFEFEPDAVSISVGQKVTFNFNSGTHTATADDGAWTSGEQSAGGSFEIAFDQAGTFAFHCQIHGSMTGTITVTG